MKIVLLIGFMVLCFTSLYAQENLVFAQPTPGYPHDAAIEVLKKAYGKLGIKFSLKPLPGKRALLYSNAGTIDGELLRIKDIVKKFPNLIVVPVPIAWLEQVVFSKNVTFHVEGWESLRPYIVGIRRGVVITTERTKGMIQEFVNSDESNFKKLAKGRIDVIARGRVAGLEIVKKLKLKDIKVLEPPLEIIKLYHCLNKKHKDLVPRLEIILKEMENSGEIKRIIEKHKKLYTE